MRRVTVAPKQRVVDARRIRPLSIACPECGRWLKPIAKPQVPFKAFHATRKCKCGRTWAFDTVLDPAANGWHNVALVEWAKVS